MVEILLNPNSIEDYRTYLKIKRLPQYRFQGRLAIFPDEYLGILGREMPKGEDLDYEPSPFLFDYQREVSRVAIAKRKFAAFIECGYGKTLILLEFIRHAVRVIPENQCCLIVSPLMVIDQTIREAKRFYGDDIPIEQVRPAGLQSWLDSGPGRIGITNYEAIREGLRRGRLGCLALDESSITKSHYGAYGQRLIELGKGVEWKLCLTGTPAPNDRIEFANHAVFLDQFPTVNAFLASYFVNRGKTSNRWEIKPHALRPFYRALSHWCIFMSRPETYGWRDNVGTIPPIKVHFHDIPLTEEQTAAVAKTGKLLIGAAGGITSRGKLSQLAKGWHEGEEITSNKPQFIRDLVSTWDQDESTIIWCRYNREQESLERMFPEAASIKGESGDDERREAIRAFQAGEIRTIISKPKVLGFGLNLQIATRHVFNGLWDSAEEYHQAVARSNRVGSTRSLNVHIPVTEIEQAMVDTVFAKLRRMEQDTLEQEAIFKGESVYGAK